MHTQTSRSWLHRFVLFLLIIGGFGAALGTVTWAQNTLTLMGVSPNTVISDQPTTLLVTGTGFTENTVVMLGNLVNPNVSFVNETMLRTEFPLALKAGVYSVSVTNPDGARSVLEGALTVENAPATTPPLTVTYSEPHRINNDRVNTLSVFGSGYAEGVVVRLVGFGILETTILHSGALTATIPANIPPAKYTIEVSDTLGNTVQSPETLRVVKPDEPTATPEPLPTPIKITTAPSLGVTNFTANPSTIMPGQSTTLSFTVNNYGNQIARAISVTLGSSSQFVVSGGIASIAVPDLGAGMSYTARLTVSAMQNVTAGVASIPLKIDYRDDLGETFSGDAALSVTISSSAVQSQILIDAYTLEPALVAPGEPVTLRLTLTNNGNALASQVKLQIGGSGSVLLPNGSGDTFFVGDLAPGAKFPVQIPLLVGMDAKHGPQVQPISMTFFQNGEAQDVSTSISINVKEVSRPQPLILLTGYSTGEDVLVPGVRFNLDITLQNVGLVEAKSMTVTFGTVQNSGGNGDNGGNSGGGQQTNTTTPSTTFAPLGTAGLSFVGTVGADETVTVSQEFIVSGDVNSGIYALPITLQYLLPDGTSKQDSMNLSLVVIVPPRLQINPLNPVPEMVSAGEPVPVSLEIVNGGRTRVDLIEATVSVTNGEILEGKMIPLESLAADDDTSLMTVVMPLAEGQLDINITLAYRNDLGQPETIELTYSAQVMPPPPPIEEPVNPMPIEPEPEPEINWLGRIIMAALGLGS